MDVAYLQGPATPLPSEESKGYPLNRYATITCFVLSLISLIGMTVSYYRGVNSIAVYSLLGFSTSCLAAGLIFLFSNFKEKPVGAHLPPQQTTLFDYILYEKALKAGDWQGVANQVDLEECPFKPIKKLYYAVKAERFDLVEKFAPAGAVTTSELNEFTEESGGKYTLLHEAVLLKDWEQACKISVALIDRGARIDLKTKETTPQDLLFLIVKRDSFTPFDEKASKSLFEKFVGNMDPKDEPRRTPLLFLLAEKSKPSKEIIRLLIDYGADKTVSFQGKTALQIYQDKFSEEQQDSEIMQLLTPRSA